MELPKLIKDIQTIMGYRIEHGSRTKKGLREYAPRLTA